MSRRCDVCGKEPQFGKKVSRLGKNAIRRRVKSRSPRAWYPNTQSMRVTVNGTSARLKVCTSCIRAGKVLRRVKN